MLVAILLSACSSEDQKHQKVKEAKQDSVSTENAERINYASLIANMEDSADILLGLGKQQFGDLDSMLSRRYIRVLVPYSPTFYYIDGIERKGLAYEALNLFEKFVQKKHQLPGYKFRVIFIPAERDYLMPLLEAGYGDMVMAGVTMTPEREDKFSFSDPSIEEVKEVVIGGPGSQKLTSLRDLSGKHVYVRLNSDYYQSLLKLNDSLLSEGKEPVQIDTAAAHIDVEDILQMVNAGIIDYTLAMEPLAKNWSTVLDSLTIYSDFPIRSDIKDGWVFRKNSPLLEKEVNTFMAKHHKGTLMGNILFNRYLKDNDRLKKMSREGTLKRLNELQVVFRKYADQYSIDWLFLIAQGYQESGLNQQLRSHAGAVGIMQVLPSTAAWGPIGIKNIYKLENNVHAGAKLMRYNMSHSLADSTLDPVNRHLMALAAYNAGAGRLHFLRSQAVKFGLNPNIWFNNVELMAAKYIGRETTTYVSNIYKYYVSFRHLARYHQRGRSLNIRES